MYCKHKLSSQQPEQSCCYSENCGKYMETFQKIMKHFCKPSKNLQFQSTESEQTSRDAPIQVSM